MSHAEPAPDAPAHSPTAGAASPPTDLPPCQVLPADEPCWRCGLSVPPGAVCPHCRARPRHAPLDDGRRLRDPARPVQQLIVAYVLLAAPTLAGGLILRAAPPDPGMVLPLTVVLQVLEAVLVLVAFAWMGRQPLPRPRAAVRAAAWLTGPLVLAGVLTVNFGFNAWLRDHLHADPAPLGEPFTPAGVMVVAVAPALIEEFFFRYLALGALARILGSHAAVLVSAVLFALAHLYAPLGLPWLLLAGLAFGGARVASGGLALPVLLHFAHNFVVLALEGHP